MTAASAPTARSICDALGTEAITTDVFQNVSAQGLLSRTGDVSTRKRDNERVRGLRCFTRQRLILAVASASGAATAVPAPPPNTLRLPPGLKPARSGRRGLCGAVPVRG